MNGITAYLLFQAALLIFVAITAPLMFFWMAVATVMIYGGLYLIGRYVFGMWRKKGLRPLSGGLFHAFIRCDLRYI